MPSPNIQTFNFSEQFDLPNGNLNLADISTYFPGGAANVLGINFAVYLGDTSGVQIYNNLSNWTTPDIIPSVPVIKSIVLPTFRNSVQWGTYTVVGNIKDQDGTIYPLIKVFNLCKPKACGCGCGCSTSANGSCAQVSVKFDCNQATTYVMDTTAFTYQGVVGSPTYSMTINFPLNSGINPVTVAANIWSDNHIYNGNYVIVINDTAVYQFTNDIQVIIGYTTTKTKVAQCNACLCGLYCALDEYFRDYEKVRGSGSQRERTIQGDIVRLTMLLFQIQSGISCGVDVSKQIEEVSHIVDGNCACTCSASQPAQGVNSLYQVLVQANGGDIEVDPVQSGTTYIFKVKDITYVLEALPGQTGINFSSSQAGQVKTYFLAIAGDELTIDNDFSIYRINPTTFVETAIDVPAGDAVGDLIDAINLSLHNIDLAFSNINDDINEITTPIIGNVVAGSATGIIGVAITYCIDGLGNCHLSGVFVVNLETAVSGAIIGTIPVNGRPVNPKAGFCLVGSNLGVTNIPFSVNVLANGQILAAWDTAVTGTSGGRAVPVDSICYNVNT